MKTITLIVYVCMVSNQTCFTLEEPQASIEECQANDLLLRTEFEHDENITVRVDCK
jgi:hypothetical protein